jgi:hypothetical protein
VDDGALCLVPDNRANRSLATQGKRILPDRAYHSRSLVFRPGGPGEVGGVVRGCVGRATSVEQAVAVAMGEG